MQRLLDADAGGEDSERGGGGGGGVEQGGDEVAYRGAVDFFGGVPVGREDGVGGLVGAVDGRLTAFDAGEVDAEHP